MSSEWGQREREYRDAVLCKLPSCSGRPNRFCAQIPKGFTFLSVPISTQNAVATCAVAVRRRRCVQAVPHNAHVEGRPLLVHCLGTPGPSIAQPAFRDQIMTTTDMNGLLFKTEINSRSQRGNLARVGKFTAVRISFKFLSFSYVKLNLILLMWRIWWAPNNASRWQMGFNSAFKGLMALFPCYCRPVQLSR